MMSSLVTRKALGAPTGACPNCWRAGVVVDLSDGSESRWLDGESSIEF